jgi:adenylosuccinate synthase
VYEELPGWQQPTENVRRYDDLPVNARRYLERLAELTGTPIVIVSTGPDREQTIVLANVFD